MAVYFNSLPFRQYVVIGSPECGFVGYGQSLPRLCCCRRRRFFQDYCYYPFSFLPPSFPRFHA